MKADPESLLQVIPALLLGLGAAYLLDRMCLARGLQPPGFRVPWRRVLAATAVAFLLALGVFGPLTVLSFGGKPEPDLSQVSTPQLFGFHLLMLATLGIWFLLGFAGRVAAPAPIPDIEVFGEEPPSPPPPPRVPLGRQFLAQFGLLAPSVPREIGVGLVLGIGAWVAVLLVLVGVGVALWALGGENAVPKEPPAMVPFIAGLPIGVRILISLSAGVVEEGFFRGFLQPRIGIPLSTAFFALAHLSYGQPFMLVGITLLSLIYAFLVRWRQNLWPAMAAHALFDGVQLLVVVPAAMRYLQGA
ncbi:MAG TPA: CPBP family intramembrane glutamic endopeptidase, partial [Thermoanaerobaculia bacterium]